MLDDLALLRVEVEALHQDLFRLAVPLERLEHTPNLF